MPVYDVVRNSQHAGHVPVIIALLGTFGRQLQTLFSAVRRSLADHGDEAPHRTSLDRRGTHVATFCRLTDTSHAYDT